jgi:hypothetical protein
MHALALALLALGSSSGDARPDANAPVEETWISLDRELEALAVSLQEPAPGLEMGALLRVNYARFDEFQPPGGMGNEYGGFILDNVRFHVGGAVGDYGLFLQVEGLNGTFEVLDAFATWQAYETVRFVMGQFQPVFLWNALVPPERLFFILRTTDSQFWHARVLGARLDGDYGRLRWALSLENGGDAQGDENAYTARVAYDVTGPGVDLVQGTYGAGEDSSLSVGLGYHDDESAADDGDVLAVDAPFTRGRFGLWADWLDYADDGGGGTGIYSIFSDTSPWSVAATWMLVPEEYEIGARWQELDDDFDTNAWTVGVNRYVHGHDVKWQLNYVERDADDGGVEDQAIAVGHTVNI